MCRFSCCQRFIITSKCQHNSWFLHIYYARNYVGIIASPLVVHQLWSPKLFFCLHWVLFFVYIEYFFLFTLSKPWSQHYAAINDLKAPSLAMVFYYHSPERHRTTVYCKLNHPRRALILSQLIVSHFNATAPKGCGNYCNTIFWSH